MTETLIDTDAQAADTIHVLRHQLAQAQRELEATRDKLSHTETVAHFALTSLHQIARAAEVEYNGGISPVAVSEIVANLEGKRPPRVEVVSMIDNEDAWEGRTHKKTGRKERKVTYVQLDNLFINIEQVKYVETHTSGKGGAWVCFGGDVGEQQGTVKHLSPDQSQRLQLYLEERSYRIA